MSLAARLALAFVVVAILCVALAGYGVRRTTREILERDFDARLQGATREVEEALKLEAKKLRDLTVPLCTRATFFDRALADFERAKGDDSALEAAGRIALRQQLPDEAAARSLDELSLVTANGTVISSSRIKDIGVRIPRYGELISGEGGTPQMRPAETGTEPQIEVWCSRTVRSYRLGLVGAQRIHDLLARVGRAHGVGLAPMKALHPTEEPHDAVVRVIALEPEVRGLTVVASVSRSPLNHALERLDRDIAISAAVAVFAALVIAILLSRNLSRPILELAKETREVIKGEPRTVKSRGSREIRDLARSFNRTIEELTRMRKRLAATERIAARREIARQVAHEIKNPLAPIRAAVETLRRLHARNDDRFEAYFDEATKTVLEEVHRITNIVSEFTKFSRLPAPSPESVDLVSIARKVVMLHSAVPEIAIPEIATPEVATAQVAPSISERIEGTAGLANSQQQTARVELRADELPTVRVDPDQIVQVLTNLIQNGLEAAQAVRPDPRVTVTLAREGHDRVRIVVRDNGPGVSADMRDKLFEPYATSKSTGTGLGLAICQRIVFEHGGEISYRPATKGGAVFEILLPVEGPSLLDRSIEITDNPASRLGSGREPA